jgi:hypothetical protein
VDHGSSIRLSCPRRIRIRAEQRPILGLIRENLTELLSVDCRMRIEPTNGLRVKTPSGFVLHSSAGPFEPHGISKKTAFFWRSAEFSRNFCRDAQKTISWPFLLAEG